MQEMSLRHLIGQRLLIGLPGLEVDEEFKDIVRTYKVGNVILMKRNVENREQTARLCAQIQEVVLRETGYPALISADQEGGTVTRLQADSVNVAGAMAVASTGKPENARLAGRITGMELSALGINFDLAPVLDVNNNPKNPVIGERSYGDTAETVTRYGLEMMHGLHEGGVLSCAKHFPGHGDTDVDSHLGLPTINKSLEQLRQMELVPFIAAIQQDIPAIMTSHIQMPQLEKNGLPNTLSRAVITGLLRQELGYKGLVVSDDMEMKGVLSLMSGPDAVLAAAKAGVDVMCICHTPKTMRDAAEKMYAAAECGELDMEEIKQSVQRVLHAKELAAKLPAAPFAAAGCEEHRAAAAAMRLQAVSFAGGPAPALPVLGAAPLFVGSHAFRSTIASSPVDTSVCFPTYMQQALGGEAIITDLNPSAEEIAAVVKAAPGHSALVVGTYNGRFQPGQIELVKALAQTGIPTIMVALRSPYDLALAPANVYKLAGFEYSVLGFAAVEQVLGGKHAPTGRLSVNLDGAAQ